MCAMRTLLEYCEQEKLTEKEIKKAISLISTSDLNEKDNIGWAVLMYAAHYGHKEIAFALINAGANLNEKDNRGRTAVMHASFYGHKEIVFALIEAGAEIDQTNDDMVKMYKQYIRECVL